MQLYFIFLLTHFDSYGGEKLGHDFLMQTSGMTRSKRSSVGNSDSSFPAPASKQLSTIMIDFLHEMSSGMLYPAGFLIFLGFIYHLLLFSYGEGNRGSERFNNLLKVIQPTV